MAGYGEFAEVYDSLTFNVPYDKIAKYYAEILSELTSGKRILDMGCGTGNLTIRLARSGFDMIGQDASVEMLSIAANKSDKVQWICQNMAKTEIGERVDGVISTLDSVNHLKSRAEIFSCFKSAAESLNHGGVFVFDVNTIYKHREILGNNTFVYDVDGVYCVWQNSFSSVDNGVDIDLDLFFEGRDGRYSRGEEHFREIALSDGEICQMLREACFSAVNIWEYLAYNKPGKDSEKMLIMAKLT